MKKILITLTMAAGMSCFAAANDPLIPANVQAGKTYGLDCKGERVMTFSSSKTGKVNFQGVAALSTDVNDYVVSEVANSQSDAGLAEEVPAESAEELDVSKFICRYADRRTLLMKGERCLLVQVKKGQAFDGLKWDCGVVDRENDKVVGIVGEADEYGRFQSIDIGKFGALDTANNDYKLVVLDSRLPNGTELSTTIAVEGVGVPRLVCGWGEFALDNEGKPSDVNWHAVNIDESGIMQVFKYDPSSKLASGLAAVYDEVGYSVAFGLSAGGDNWLVFPYPKAIVSTIDNISLANGENYADLRTNIPQEYAEKSDKFTLESTYKFEAFQSDFEKQVVLEALAGQKAKNVNPFTAFPDDASKRLVFQNWYLRVVPFFQWNVDFEVSFDRPIAAHSFILAGFYDYNAAWGNKMPVEWANLPWIGSSALNDMVPGDSFRLLRDYKGDGVGQTINFEEICTKVQEFKCGVYNCSEKNWGTTIRVNLNVYENTGRCNEDQFGNYHVTVGTYEYTFKGPLSVVFTPDTESGLQPVDAVMPANISTNHDGRTELPLPVPAYDSKAKEDIAFVGWSNVNTHATYTFVPTNTWGTIELKPVWKAAKTVSVLPKAGAEETTIKIAQEWIDANVGQGVTDKKVIEEEITKTVEGGTIPLWQTYVLGLNPSGTVAVVATEKLAEDKALVVSTVQAPAPDAGFKVTYSLDKIDKTSEEPIDPEHKGVEQVSKDIAIDLEPTDDTPTGYYKMNVFITPEKDGQAVVDEKVQVKSEVTVGVLKVETEEPVVPVAVPWTSLENVANDIPADEIVQPQGLNEDDKLFIYDKEGRVYNTLVLKGGKWVSGTDIEIGAQGDATQSDAEAAKPTVPRGSGMWLKRSDTSKPFYLFGQYNKTASSTKIVAPKESGKTEYNLIAPTSIEETDLNAVPTLNPGAEGAGDKLMIVNNGNPVYYNYENGKWGYNGVEIVEINGKLFNTKKRVTEGIKVPAGTGLWYISAGGEPTITWEETPANPGN